MKEISKQEITKILTNQITETHLLMPGISSNLA